MNQIATVDTDVSLLRLVAVGNYDSDTSRDKNAPPLVNELRKAKLNAVRTLGAVCIAGGIPVEIQVMAAKTLLEFKLETIRDIP